MHTDNVSTTAAESRDRKTTKPIMEKRRRARINASLAELKSLLLEVIKREGARHSKMEKADILEMTVKHLRDMQRQSFTAAAANDPTVRNKHRLGFSECTQEVSRYLSNIDGCDVELRTRLLEHLANFVSGLDHNSSPSPPVTSHPESPSPSTSSLPVLPCDHTFHSTKARPVLPQSSQASAGSSDMNNNIAILSPSQNVQPTKVVSGLQVIPAKLQTGEIAFVLPGTSSVGSHIPNYIIPVYTSPSVAPLKPTVTMTTGVSNPGSFMTLVPSADVIQTCALSPGSINIVSQHSVSPSSTSTSSVLSMSPQIRHADVDINHGHIPSLSKDEPEIRHQGVRDLCGIPHKEVTNLSTERHEGVRDYSEMRHPEILGFSYRHDDGNSQFRGVGDTGEGRCKHVSDLHNIRHMDLQVTGDRLRNDDKLSEERSGQDACKIGEVRHDDMRVSGHVRHDGVRDIGQVCHEDGRDIGQVRHDDLKDSDQVCHDDVKDSGQLRHDNVRDSGHVRHDVGDSGQVRHEDVGDSDRVRHQGVMDIHDRRQPDDRELGIRRQDQMDISVWRPW